MDRKPLPGERHKGKDRLEVNFYRIKLVNLNRDILTVKHLLIYTLVQDIYPFIAM